MERNKESQFKVERQKEHKIIAEVKEMGFTRSSERQESTRVRLDLLQASAPKPRSELSSGLSARKRKRLQASSFPGRRPWNSLFL